MYDCKVNTMNNMIMTDESNVSLDFFFFSLGTKVSSPSPLDAFDAFLSFFVSGCTFFSSFSFLTLN